MELVDTRRNNGWLIKSEKMEGRGKKGKGAKITFWTGQALKGEEEKVKRGREIYVLVFCFEKTKKKSVRIRPKADEKLFFLLSWSSPFVFHPFTVGSVFIFPFTLSK